MAILILDDEEVLSINDPVSKYAPWFNVKYDNKNVDVTLNQLLLHTSGIPNHTMNRFPEGTSDELLEKTVRLTEGITLDNMPGSQFEYANIGYDLLAYIIEAVTGKKYEDFVNERILIPLNMKNSTFEYEKAVSSENMAQGYMQFFRKAVEYDAPRYQGCLGDGYLITCTSDMGLWLNAQMGGDYVPEQLARLIKKSHEILPDNKIRVSSFRGIPVYYANGWEVSSDGSMITHSGSNPNFSSNIILIPDSGISVCVMSNIQGNHTVDISKNIIKAFWGENLIEPTPENGGLDSFFSLCIKLIGLLMLIQLIRLFFIKKQLVKKKKSNVRIKITFTLVRLVIYAILIVIFGIWPYLVGYNYRMVQVWLPGTVFICGLFLFALAFLLLISSIVRLIIIYRVNTKL